MMNLGTLDQAAQALGCCTRTVRRHVEAGRLNAYRNHAKRGILVDLDAVANLARPHQGGEAMMNLGTLDQAAQALGCSARTIRRHIEAGRLDAYRNTTQRGILVDLDAVANLAQPRKITR